MKEIIEQINEIDKDYGGYEITTNQRKISLTISMGSSCCEIYGFFSTFDDKNDFIGSELLNVSRVGTDCNKEVLERHDVSEDVCMFINFETSNGLFQIAVYNEHNGYYSHTVKIEIGDLKEEDYL